MTNPTAAIRTAPNFHAAKKTAKPRVRAHAGDRFTVVYRGVWAEFCGVWDKGVRSWVYVNSVTEDYRGRGCPDFVCALGQFVRACDFAAEVQRGCKAKGNAFAGSTSWGSTPTRWEGVTGSHVVVTRTSTYRGETSTICNAFEVGDRASYGSYSVTYYGTIVSITAKRIGVREGVTGKLHSMTHEKFASRNDHDFAATAERDAHTRMTM